ncbi:hypothetical protein BC936DRAFT_147821, partial [Jimgerdemannia flammicorona]
MADRRGHRPRPPSPLQHVREARGCRVSIAGHQSVVLPQAGAHAVGVIWYQEAGRWRGPFNYRHLSYSRILSSFHPTPPPNLPHSISYWENACQIIPPHDTGITASIEKNLEPWIWDADLVSTHPLALDPERKGVIDAYFEEVAQLSKRRWVAELVLWGAASANASLIICARREHNTRSHLKFVYTAMHGVGTPYARRSFEAFGLKPFIEVPEQVQPDPDFPTVAFPNPEEGKGAL